jgi:uncharacterized protein YjbJ (UPF0337 family)
MDPASTSTADPVRLRTCAIAVRDPSDERSTAAAATADARVIFGITEVLLRAAIDGESTRFTRQDSIAETKGRVKEAAGALTGNRRLKNKGRVDQAKGAAKSAVDMVTDSLTGRNRIKR